MSKDKQLEQETKVCIGRCGLPGGCRHTSDCPVHNEPAHPAGDCNCRVSKQQLVKSQETNYSQHDHSHCWEQDKEIPACGIEMAAHKVCCLCEIAKKETK